MVSILEIMEAELLSKKRNLQYFEKWMKPYE